MDCYVGFRAFLTRPEVNAKTERIFLFRHIVILALFAAGMSKCAEAGNNRSTYIRYDNSMSGREFRSIAFDAKHLQIFAAWESLDRIDVFSSADYHVIRSMAVPSPTSLDISPNGNTLAVTTASAHILFFDTGSYAKVDDVVFADSALGVTAFVYTANGNGFVRAQQGISTGGGVTAYWDHLTNNFIGVSSAMTFTGPYLTSGPMSRSGDYSKVLLGDPTTAGGVQIIDGNTGQVLQALGYGGYIMGLAANQDGSRYAICAAPAGFGGFLIILDSSFNEIYQDEAGCLAMIFSPDGKTLYRDAGGVTQGLDINSFSVRSSTTNFFSNAGGSFPTLWQAADGTGVVYGVNHNAPNGDVFVAVDTTVASTGPAPAVNDAVHIVRVIDTVGSPQGGDLIRILCTGADNASDSSITVKVGGVLGNGAAVNPARPGASLPNLRIVTVRTPPGTPGLADVTLSIAGQSDVAVKAFQYAQSKATFPFPTSPNFLLYDRFRKRLYAAHKDQVEVIDPIGQQVLTALVPAGGKLANSQFAGISLSPDGSRLYVADAGANLVHVLNLTNPGTGISIDPAKAIGFTSPISPGRVFEMINGELVGSDTSGNAFRLNPQAGSGSWMIDGFGNQVASFTWTSIQQGRFALMSRGINGLISSQLAWWDATSSEYAPALGEAQWIVEADANEDGTYAVAGGSTPGLVDTAPEILDLDLNAMGILLQHYDVDPPVGTPSFFLDRSGALLYKAGTSSVGGSVEIDDTHRWQAVGSVVFPEPFVTSYSPFTDHMVTTDETGRYLFGVTTSGISMMKLNTIPLSIGNLQPAFGQPSGGEQITIRGTGFQQGVRVIFGGTSLVTTFVDESTLTITSPPLTAGWQDVTVTNPSGTSYTAAGAFQVATAPTIPKITGFTPPSVAISLGPDPLTVTIVGSGFDADDTVEMRGEPIESTFVDSSHIKVTLPWQVSGETGSVSFTVESPYTGESNTLSLPLVNAVPVIHKFWPPTLATGTSTNNFEIYGINFVQGSVVRWNGQPLVTTVVGGLNSDGDELLIASVSASLLTNRGTAAVTVFNPTPGGGISNTISEDVSPAHPLVTYPSSIDFGNVLLSYPVVQTIQLWNLGSANYTVTSTTVGAGPYSVLSNSCTNIPFSPIYASSCALQLQFSPTTAGAFNTTLSVVDNSVSGTLTIPITGTGTQHLIPTVILNSANALGQTVDATLYGSATVGGPGIPANAWIEYGTDTTLSTYSTSATWTFTGDGPVTGGITGLSPATTYAVRLAVQTPGGTGRSSIKLLATMPAWPWVRLDLPPGASNVATVSAGQSAMYQLLVSDGGNGYTGTAVLACSGAPVGAKCSVAPSPVQIGVQGTPVTITITTTKATASLTWPSHTTRLLALLVLTGLAFVFVPQPARRTSRVLGLVVVAGFLSSCGGGSGSGSSPGPGPGSGSPTPTPVGTYSVTITGSTGGAHNSYLLTLIVK